MRVPDAYRAQLFVRRLAAGMGDLERSLLASGCAANTIEDTIADLATGLATELDSMTLPVIALELAIAKELGLLSGDTAKQRYESFFERDGRWHERARALLLRYHFLDQLIDRYVTSTVAALTDSVRALATDLDDIRRTFLKPKESVLVALGLLGDGDRHKGGRRPLWMRFDMGTVLVYKPVDFATYRFFDRFARALDLPAQNDCFLPRVISKDGYGWMEYVEQQDCREEDEVGTFFRRFGVLLAVGEAVNLVDGHSENLIAFGSYPVLVDLETVLHNHSMAESTPNVFHTLLIEKVPEDGRLNSALMAPPATRRNTFGAYPTSDQTDDLSVWYGRPVARQPSNIPTLKGHYVTAFEYVEELVAGYRATYDRISEWLVEERSRISCLDAAKACRPRAVVRSTAYYSYVLRRIEQPEGCVRKPPRRSSEQHWLPRDDFGNRRYTTCFTTTYRTSIRNRPNAIFTTGTETARKRTFSRPVLSTPFKSHGARGRHGAATRTSRGYARPCMRLNLSFPRCPLDQRRPLAESRGSGSSLTV